MVMQQEVVDEILLPHLAGLTYSVAWGESATVTYTDNAITTTNFTDSTATAATSNNELIVTTNQLSTEGNGSDYNAILISDSSSNAVNKCLFTQYTKTSTMQVRTIVRMAFYVR